MNAEHPVPNAPPSTFVAAPPRPRPDDPDDASLAGADAPSPEGVLGIVDALLKSPASILADLRDGRGVHLRLAAVVLATTLVTGVVMATFSGGEQLALVPLKIAAGAFLCALVCLPSLHVFSCLSGATQTLRETSAALLMGIALMGVLLVAFAPIVWVFSQASQSIAFMGALHLAFFFVSAMFGLGLALRALAAMNGGARMRGAAMWSVLFVVVLLQMSTTLRPLVGPYDGALTHDRMFFLTHWIACLST